MYTPLFIKKTGYTPLTGVCFWT